VKSKPDNGGVASAPAPDTNSTISSSLAILRRKFLTNGIAFTIGI
jgi:hypothetical protein